MTRRMTRVAKRTAGGLMQKIFVIALLGVLVPLLTGAARGAAGPDGVPAGNIWGIILTVVERLATDQGALILFIAFLIWLYINTDKRFRQYDADRTKFADRLESIASEYAKATTESTAALQGLRQDMNRFEEQLWRVHGGMGDAPPRPASARNTAVYPPPRDDDNPDRPGWG
jgi:hypothetical protein